MHGGYGVAVAHELVELLVWVQLPVVTQIFFMDFAPHLFNFITTYGYVAVFLGAILEGESILLLGGLLAFQGHLSIYLVIVFAFLGSIFGDMGWFLLGRYKGERLLIKWKWLNTWIGRPMQFIAKKPRLISVGMRFMYGFRHIIPFGLGMTNMRFSTFFYFNAIGAFLWVIIFSVLGYVLGDALEVLFGNLKRYEITLVILVILIIVLFNVFVRIFRYIVDRSIEK